MLESGYSRIPVYDGSIDNVVGIFIPKNLSGNTLRILMNGMSSISEHFYMSLRLLLEVKRYQIL